MRIHPRYYPLILITAFLVFLLLGLLLGFQPERGGHSRGLLPPSSPLTLAGSA